MLSVLRGWLPGWYEGRLYRITRIEQLPGERLAIWGIFAEDGTLAVRRPDVRHCLFVPAGATLRQCQLAIWSTADALRN